MLSKSRATEALSAKKTAAKHITQYTRFMKAYALHSGMEKTGACS